MREHLLRKPLVRFETRGRAQLVSYPFKSEKEEATEKVEKEEEGGRGEEEEAVKDTKSPPRRARKKFKKIKSKRHSSKPVAVKGHLTLKVPGYRGKQKVPLSKLVPHLPVKNLRQAAKKVLIASGLRPLSKRKKKTQPQDVVKKQKTKTKQPTLSLFDYG